jgi:hypothetical protein
VRTSQTLLSCTRYSWLLYRNRVQAGAVNSQNRTSGEFRQIHIDEIDVASPDLAASFVGGATEKTPG